MNNKQQDIVFSDEQIWSETNARTAIYYEGITLTYQINPEKSAWIYANVSDYKSSLVSKDILASAIKSSSKSLNDEDATNRSIIEPLVVENLKKALDEKYGENVVYVNKITAKANKMLEESLNDKILRDKYIDKWNGELPQVVSDEASSVLIPSSDTTK